MYQLIWLGDSDAVREREIISALTKELNALGIDATAFLRSTRGVAACDWRDPVVGVWFGEANPETSADIPALDVLLTQGCAVFPVVDDLRNFGMEVPRRLHALNGFPWLNGADRLAADILRDFGLTRQQRSVFISYKRTHSEAVAIQLFHTLSDHGYRAFLDTASVDFGVGVQDLLWDRMSDADLVIFIDTPGALSSQWVADELTRAHNLSMGVLQLVWPEQEPYAGTDLCSRFFLKAADFIPGASYEAPAGSGTPSRKGEMEAGPLKEVVKAAELVRVRSIGSRRHRIVGEIVKAARARGLDATPDHAGRVQVKRPGPPVTSGKASAVIGMPSSESIFAASSYLNPGGPEVRLVYDRLGASAQRLEYLQWLDREIKAYRMVPLDGLDDWLGQL